MSSWWRRVDSLFSDFRLVLGSGWRRLPWLLLLMLSMTALDVLSVMMVAPFLARIVGGGNGLPAAVRAISDGWSLRLLGSLVLLAFAIKAVVALWVQQRIAFIAGAERARLMSRLLDAYQGQSYQYHLQRNSSELINVVVWYSAAFTSGVLQALLQLLANGLVLIALAAVLALTHLPALLLLAAGLAGVMVLVAVLVRPALALSTRTATEVNAHLMSAASQALSGLREIRLLGRESYFRDRLDQAGRNLVHASAVQTTLAQLPRQAIEVAVIGLLVAMVWVVTRQPGSMAAAVPVLGVFATAGLRLMPASTALLSSWNGLRSNVFAIRALAKVLRSPPHATTASASSEDETAEIFERLELDGVSHRYPESKRDAVVGVSLAIERGQAIGIMGQSGAGKSTLADMLLGLLSPSEGCIKVNGWNMAEHTRRWQAMTAYIPQTVFLIDDSLRRNVALGLPDAAIDPDRLRIALKAAQLDQLVGQLPQGIDTLLGERGVRLSGGQRQRVAIARAL
ncbi:MAG: ATP-binding cassette domain-containing protein, partial [Steroidobacteraceae bacterium]